MRESWLGPPLDIDSHYGTFRIRHFDLAGIEGVAIEGHPEESEPEEDRLTVTEPILVRLQSSCVFSEAFAAADCDCALQLSTALRLVDRQGGLVVYTYEEGRGVGLARKIEAIRIQRAEGLDTAAAYRRLGLSADSRSFGTHAKVTKAFVGDRGIVLLTNNPLKLEALRKEGVSVVGRQSLVVTPSAKVEEYLANKAKALGHLLGDP